MTYITENILVTRAIVPDVDWQKCIFCEQRKASLKVHRIEFDYIEQTVMKLVETDHNLKQRI